MPSFSLEQTLFLIHHIVLPPKLPQENDWSVQNEDALLDTTVETLRTFGEAVRNEQPQVAGQIESVASTIDNLRRVRNTFGFISESQLVELLHGLASDRTCGVVPLEIKKQNAAVIVSKQEFGADIVFEVFELSPPNEDVMMTKGCLKRSFPTFACQVSLQRFQERGLVESVAHTLGKMSVEEAPGFQPQTRKNKEDHDETRDTTHPGLVTDFFMHLVSAIGQPTSMKGVRKNTREDVLWDNSLLPWRRSPLWLLVRTTMHLQFNRISSGEMYKVVMVNLLSSILETARVYQGSIDTDLFYVTSAKLSGRLQKLKQLISPRLFDAYTKFALVRLEDTRSWMKMKIERLTHSVNNNIDMTVLASLQPRNDIDIHIPQLDEFIVQLSRRKRQSGTSNFQPTSRCLELSEHELPTNFYGSGEYTYFYLATVEGWVENHLSDWLKQNISNSTTCEKLCRLLKDYFYYANSTYSAVCDIPRSLSIMYLTSMELWIACDKCACNLYPLLHDFDPEVDLYSFQSLSLPFKSQLERLFNIEAYLQSRRNNAGVNAPSLYRDFGHRDSFAVRFFNNSLEHQRLRSDIEQQARERRQAKCEELVKKKSLYHNLKEESDKRSCDYRDFYEEQYDFTRTEHSPWCERCRLQSEAESLQIQVHEWPLSSDQAVAKATVFELKVPKAYSEWREASTFVQMEVLSFTHAIDRHPRARYMLSSQDGLNSFWTSPSNLRISIVSEDKPLTGSHYRVKQDISFLQERNICVDNALHYQYFDNKKDVFFDVLCSTQQVSQKCTYQLPARSSGLQTYLQTPTTSSYITSNWVIASMSDCPSHFSLDEYKAFGSLPIGYRIQYQNILVQLAMPTIDLAKIETQCLILQTIHRAGPPSAGKIVERIAHEILTDDTFCQAVSSKIGAALERVSENWETWRVVATLVQLTLRMLSFNNSEHIASKCLVLLEEARQISFKWLNHLKNRLFKATDDLQRKELSSRLSEIGLLCTATFDVDEIWLESFLSTPSSVSVLVQASIVVQENNNITSSEHEYLHHAMVQSWRLLLFRAFPIISRNISHDTFQKGLNQAVEASWAAFHPANHWTVLDNPWHHWIYTECDTLAVHFNLLTAELLVKGLPLSRLPQPYMEHHLYSSLFDGMPIEVMPTNEPGMEFSAKRPFHPDWNYSLSFGLKDGDMLLSATRDKTKFELLPSRVFKDRLPAMFVDDYFHWFNSATKEVEFRPKHDPWSPIGGLWRLTSCAASWRLVNGRKTLVDPGSNTGNTISKMLSPLDLQSHIHVLIQDSSDISIELPRRQLGFYHTTGESKIHSQQYQGMIIDIDQRIGALSGLANRIILRHERVGEDRLALIPEGIVKYSGTVTGHVCVVELNTAWAIHAYQIDETLGRLIDNGSLQSKLFLCYLHALTSHCIPDTLTGCTGTEAALSILRSMAVASFDVLSASNISILQHIARLTPGREFYPAHMRVMQQVRWDQNLAIMSQHPGFYTAVNELFSIARKKKFLQPKNVYVDPPELDFVASCLLQRDTIRTSNFRVDGFGAEHHTHEFDRDYKARAIVADPQRGLRCAVVAEMVYRNRPAIHSSVNARDLQSSLRTTHLHDSTVKGPDGKLEPLTLRYDASWLKKPSSFLPDIWCNLHLLLATKPHCFNKFALMTWLSTVAFAEFADMNVIQALASFYNCVDLAPIEIPSVTDFDLAKGDSPTLSAIEDLVRTYKPFRTCPEYHRPQLPGESQKQWNNRRKTDYENNRRKAARSFASAIHVQWPCEIPTTPSIQFTATYLDTESAILQVRRMFKHWYDNHRFFQYLEKVSSTLVQQDILPVETNSNHIINPGSFSAGIEGFSYYSIDAVFKLKAPVLFTNSLKSDILCWPAPPAALQIPTELQSIDEGTNQAKRKLNLLCRKLRIGAKSSREKDYILDLRDSCDSLALQEARYQVCPGLSSDELISLLDKYLGDRRQYFEDINSLLQEFVESGDGIAARSGQSPRISPTFWLRQLNRDRFDSLTQDWKLVIIEYGLTVTEFHRAQRLLKLSHHPSELADELRNCGHQNWSPMDFPETLLLEVESGLMVREVQEEIAKQMRCPPNDANYVMQLNMGEGKSSVIVQIIAAFLAQGQSLVRVIVAKPQSRQMFQMLVSKLGGLMNRRIYHMPFSRALKLNASQADIINEMYQECMINRGVMLVQPEHLLSFKLMGIECLLAGQPDLGRSLLETQRFLDTRSRDIVDESDENFNVKFELVYTMGTQRSIELSPERWTIIHSVLGLVIRYAADVKEKFPSSIEFDDRWGSRYPRTRILRSDAEERLLDLISEHVCERGIPGLFFVARQPSPMKQAVLRYIRKTDIAPADVDEVEQGSFWTENTQGPLLLLRGLIAGGVLSFALKSKRWRVNYGIDPSRKPKTHLAVPYRSKDSPSPRSEFSHPDVVITLTSLAYYYGGLGDQDLFDTFAHLEKSDQADVEYQEWVRWAECLPAAFRHLNGVNIKDVHECTTKIFPWLRFSKGVVDYFLSHIVFPRAMKEFPHKLSASGWDLGAIKCQPTTGFSGTNDSRHLLPLSVNYLDSEKQKHTNALVLAYLLQDENSIKLLPPQTDAEHLLKVVNIMEPPTQVILDAGAQILELSNIQVAETWLRISQSNSTKVKAVIFFDDNEELSVLDRSGRVKILQTSPFAKHLDQCLIYLDQAHTRGTDLKMPKHYRAAVTLGANLTKDTLVQACMRMRKLGKGQSVIFCIPGEIQTKIVECTSKLDSREIEVSDVLVWAITETWAETRRSIPLWATQGRRYEDHKDCLNGEGTSLEQAKKFLEKEAQSLKDRYRPRPHEPFNTEDWNTTNGNIREILERCHNFEAKFFDTATLQEEQERELSPEIEEEREVQRPAPMEAEKHEIHPDLVRLIDTGDLRARSDAFLPAFQSLKLTSAAKRFDLTQFPNDLLVTADFMRTVKLPGGVMSESYVSDSYLRPMQWILSVMRRNETSTFRRLIILSPSEADILFPAIQKSDKVTLHLYAPRLTQGYGSLDTLDLYCVGRTFSASSPSISRSQIVQLNLFAGQLYFEFYTEYVELCKFLGLAWEASKEGQELHADGFIKPPAGAWGLNESPVGFIKEYLKIAREGEGIEKTHLGRVLEGGLLEEREFKLE